MGSPSIFERIDASFLRHRGLHATIRNAPYGAFQTEILDASSAFWEFDADLVFLLPTLRDLNHRPQPTSDESAIDVLVEAELKLWHSLWERLEMPVVQFTIAPGPTRSLGEADGLYPGGELHYIREVNRRLVREAPSHVSFVDTERLAIQVGPGGTMRDCIVWQSSRFPWKPFRRSQMRSPPQRQPRWASPEKR